MPPSEIDEMYLRLRQADGDMVDFYISPTHTIENADYYKEADFRFVTNGTMYHMIGYPPETLRQLAKALKEFADEMDCKQFENDI